MAVNPEIRAILDYIASRGVPPFHELSPEEARVNMLKARAVFSDGTVELPRVEDRAIPGPAGEVPVRIYAPEGGGPLPVLVYYHGGGWVLGNLDTHDDLCRRLAQPPAAWWCRWATGWPRSTGFPRRWRTAWRRCAGFRPTPRSWAATRRASRWGATAPGATWPLPRAWSFATPANPSPT